MFPIKTGVRQFCLTNYYNIIKQIIGASRPSHSWLLVLLLGLSACQSAIPMLHRKERQLSHLLTQSPTISSGHVGLLVTEPSKSKSLFSFSEKKLFIPASTTKILTLAECLSILGDTLSGLEFRTSGDTIFFRGTGDPCLLHPELEAYQTVFEWLKQVDTAYTLVYNPHPKAPTRFGPGWAWDDYPFGFQPERNPMPIYGNTAQVAKGVIQPSFFANRWNNNGQKELRLEFDNQWSDHLLQPEKSRTVPFRTDEFTALLADTLNRTVVQGNTDTTEVGWSTVPGCPTDTLYRKMMLESDNLIAEQLYWRLQVEHPMPVGWYSPIKRVDGSGLSRYNMISPEVLCLALVELYRNQPMERIEQLFPAGGRSGTLEKWFGNGENPPYVFAKTGSMSGVYCLAGYIKTKKDKTLIFSFMCNNFIGSNSVLKEELRVILEYIRDKM